MRERDGGTRGTRGTTTPRREAGSPLSARRAFVVHLGPIAGAGRRRFRGRVEHLSSGASAHFSSLDALLAFFTAIVDAAPGAEPRDPEDSAPGRRPARRS